MAAYRYSIEANNASHIHDANFYIAMLTAGVYLVVRGLDNVHQGFVKEPADPAANWARERLRKLFPANMKIIIEGKRAAPGNRPRRDAPVPLFQDAVKYTKRTTRETSEIGTAKVDSKDGTNTVNE